MAGPAAPIIGSAVRASGGSASRSSGSGSSRGRSASRSSGSSVSSAKQARRHRICKTCPTWRYRVGARKLGNFLGYKYYHLFVIAWERKRTGSMPTYSAFASQDGNPNIFGILSGVSTSDSSKRTEENHTLDPNDDSDYGVLYYQFSPDYSTSGEYRASNKMITLKDTNVNYNPRLVAASRAIDAKKIKYNPTGPNSNSFAMSIVRHVRLPNKYPNVNAPGAGMNLL